ncbi:MAG: hypothetical protein H6983_19010 [Ectothiorhodospiraceae bacterium]|nr:hypothetical protein [Ectothiorhodospiraceae bacterium]
MRPELDLQRSIRPGLDILANEIVIALRKRARFPANPAVYEPGLVVSDRSMSLLDHVLRREERVHAELGRYLYASQEAFSDVSDVVPVIDRAAPPSPVQPMHSGMGPRLVAFWRQWIDTACQPGTNPDTYGETVTADVQALLAIMERINLGKYVAESKLEAEPEAFARTGGEREGILALIVKPEREAQVLELARKLARHYELEPERAVEVFQWMIAATVDIEVDYIRMRLGLHRQHP